MDSAFLKDNRGSVQAAFEKIFVGLIFAIILGAIIVGLYPSMSISYGNTQVFPLGGVVLLLVGMLGLIFIYLVIKSAMDEMNEGKNPFMGGGGGY
jgi:uncharacterized integral membrane protein